MKILEQTMTSGENNQRKRITANDIKELQDKLFNLPLKGRELRQIMEVMNNLVMIILIISCTHL